MKAGYVRAGVMSSEFNSSHCNALTVRYLSAIVTSDEFLRKLFLVFMLLQMPCSVLRNDTFCVANGCLLHCKKPSFALQKATYHLVKACLSGITGLSIMPYFSLK